MPYKPTELTYREQAQQWYREHPEAVANLRANGIRGSDPILYDPQAARDNPGVGLPPTFLQPLQEKKQRYYRRHPDQDPQSTMSKVMQFLGLDEPYVHDSRSLDYNNKVYEDSLKEGNPDMRFSIPAYNDAVHDVTEGSMDNNYGEPDNRTENERWQGMIDNFLNFPTLGMEDEIVAGAGALTGHGTYDENLQRARDVEDRNAEHTPIWTQVGQQFSSLPIDGIGFAASMGAAKRGIKGLRKIAGLAPEAKTAIGRGATELGATSAAMAGDDSLWQMGNARGNLQERAEQFHPEWAGAAAMFPVYMGVGSGLGKLAEMGGKALTQGGRKLARASEKFDIVPRGATIDDLGPKAPKLPKPNQPEFPLGPRPRTPKLPLPRAPQDVPDSIRDDLERAIQASRMRDRG